MFSDCILILYTTCGIIQYRGQGQRPDGAVDGSHANRGRVQCLSSHNICRPSPTVLSAFMQSPRSLHPFLRTPLLSPQRAAGILFAYRNNVLCICANCVELELYKRNWVPAGLNLFLPVCTTWFPLTLTCLLSACIHPIGFFLGRWFI